MTDVHQGPDDRHDVATPEPAPAPRPAPTPGPRPGPVPRPRPTADVSPAVADDVRQGVVDELRAEQVLDGGGSDVAARTAAVERLPLVERADGFATLHDDLRTRLESGGVPRG